jgi:hypothetical protein
LQRGCEGCALRDEQLKAAKETIKLLHEELARWEGTHVSVLGEVRWMRRKLYGPKTLDAQLCTGEHDP